MQTSWTKVTHRRGRSDRSAAQSRDLRARRSSSLSSGGRAPAGLSPPTGVIDSSLGVIYTYSAAPGLGVSFEGGPVVRSARLVVLFWGDQWGDPAISPAASDIVNAFTSILNSPYLSEVKQYGFEQLESLEFARVEGSNPPSPTYLGSDAKNLVWDLIDNGAYPEPRDPGGRIIYVVLPHAGTTYTDDEDAAAGGHGPAPDYDFPASVQYAWVSWVNYGPIDGMTSVFTHELVETLSDPELDAWREDGQFTEIADIGLLQNGPAGDRAGDYAVAAYYSRRLDRNVVPSWGLFRHVTLAQIDQGVGPVTEFVGATVPDPGQRCYSGAYSWTLVSRGQKTTLAADVSTYSQPSLDWSVNGKTIVGTTSFELTVDNTLDPLNSFAPSHLRPEVVTVTVDLDFEGHSVVITCPAGAGAVRLDVTCTVTDSARFAGYDTARKTFATVITAGRSRRMEPRLANDRERCTLAGLELLNSIVPELAPLAPGGGPEPIWLQATLVELEAHVASAVALGTRALDWWAQATIPAGPGLIRARQSPRRSQPHAGKSRSSGSNTATPRKGSKK